MTLDRAQLALVAVVAANCLLSIFAAQIALALAIAVFVARLATGRARLARTPLDGPVLVFSVWTLLSASFSADPLVSHDNAKKLVLFILIYLALDSFGREQDRERLLDVAVLGGLALSAGIVLQYYFAGFDSLANRPHSFMGHYMTASGLSMAVLVLAAARLTFAGAVPRPSHSDVRLLVGLGLGLLATTLSQHFGLFALESERLFVAGFAATAAGLVLARGPWPRRETGALIAALAVPVAAWALLLSRTRNAWLGALAGLAVVAVLRSRSALWALATAVAVVLVLRPAPLIDRLTVSDDSSRDRYYMWQAGIDMILDRPVFGQGPGMVLQVYPRYRWPEAPNPRTPHLHDNALQIAAERGIPCLVFWLWLVATVLADAGRESRRGAFGVGWIAPATLSLVVAVMVAGLFEYNFGDSEILMLTLIVSALPYALRRQREAEAHCSG